MKMLQKCFCETDCFGCFNSTLDQIGNIVYTDVSIPEISKKHTPAVILPFGRTASGSDRLFSSVAILQGLFKFCFTADPVLS